MSPEEWAPIAAFIENTWKDELDDVRLSAYYRALGHLPAEVVDEAATRLAGGRALSAPPVSAGGHYLPSSEAIARECAAIAYIGTWDWAHHQLHRWVWALEAEKAPRTGRWRLDDEDFTVAAREQLLAVDEVHGRKLVGLVESFGLRFLSCHRGGNFYLREGRHRWAHLTLEAVSTEVGATLIDPRAR